MSKNKSAAPSKQCKKTCCTDCQSWVFILKEFQTNSDDPSKPAAFVQLRHPKSDSAALFLVSPENKTVQEVLSFYDKPRSFFFDNQVKSDGRIFLSTPIDPLFLALPYIKKYGKCSPLDHIITDDDFPETERLLECPGLTKYIHHIADKRGDDSLNAYAYNEEKTLKWLEKKVKKVASALEDEGIHVAVNSAISANFIVVKEEEAEDKNAYLRYAAGMVSNYLPESLTSALENHLNLAPREPEKKRKSNPVENYSSKSSKKLKVDEENITSPSPTPAKEKKTTPSAKEKAMAKAASGTKNIMSFFKKK